MARGLTAKQFVFCEAYLETLNGTEAAKRAYKAKSESAFGVIASLNLRKLKIREYIDKRLTEMQMGANEVLVRLSQQGKTNIADFVREEKFTVTTKDGRTYEDTRMALNWDKVRSHGHLIKSITNTRHGPRIEMYDGQTALIRIGMRHGLFIEKHEITLGYEDEVLQLIRSGKMTPEQAYIELGDDLATELFERAGISITKERTSTPGSD